MWSDERAQRVLDAAADLLVRWGFQRVTIDDVAHHAGIGKGTVYLHFPSKEALFLTVLLRTHHTLVNALADRMEADPAAALPSQLVRATHLAPGRRSGRAPALPRRRRGAGQAGA